MEIKILDKTFIPYISKEELFDAINKIAAEINKAYENKNPLFIGVLNGSFMFCSDLMKAITIKSSISFVKMASYEGTTSTGKVQEIVGLSEAIENRHVIILEDIVDTGNTLEKLIQLFQSKKTASLKIATLLYKPEAYKKPYPIDYIGIEIPNKFVVGYGLDYDGYGRNLDSIYVLKE